MVIALLTHIPSSPILLVLPAPLYRRPNIHPFVIPYRAAAMPLCDLYHKNGEGPIEAQEGSSSEKSPRFATSRLVPALPARCRRHALIGALALRFARFAEPEYRGFPGFVRERSRDRAIAGGRKRLPMRARPLPRAAAKHERF